MRKRSFFACALLLATLLPVSAEPASDQQVEELLLAAQVPKMIETSIEQVRTMFNSDEFVRSLSGKANPETIKKIQNQAIDITAKELGWEQMKADYIKIYAEVFSKEEVEGLTEFYKTPLGRALLAKTPELMQKAMSVGQARMVKIMPEVQAATEALLKEEAEKAKAKNEEEKK